MQSLPIISNIKRALSLWLLNFICLFPETCRNYLWKYFRTEEIFVIISHEDGLANTFCQCEFALNLGLWANPNTILNSCKIFLWVWPVEEFASSCEFKAFVVWSYKTVLGRLVLPSGTHLLCPAQYEEQSFIHFVI